MIGVLIIPTGVGAEIGGHSGDGNPVARLFGSLCNTLITHPNVVNASDINEMPPNTLYVEGSALDRFLSGDISLVPVSRPNKILVVANSPLRPETINAVSASRATLGCNVSMVGLSKPLEMCGWVVRGNAVGAFRGEHELLDQIKDISFDALAVTTPITVPKETCVGYLRNGGANPWGKVEADLSRYLSTTLGKPVAHAPVNSGMLDDFDEVVDPRMSAEMVSICNLHSVLKGLHYAPRLCEPSIGLTNRDVDFMVSPWGCWGRPHDECRKSGIPIIGVRENKTNQSDACDFDYVASNYWEAAGIVASWNARIFPESVRRPLLDTGIIQ